MWIKPQHVILGLIVAAFCAGCGGNGSNSSAKYQQFFVGWLEDHGEKNVVTDAQGVGLAGNATRLQASLYGSNRTESGYTVELEFKIKLPDGREIIEYLAGPGETEEHAIDDCLANFVLSTFHVVYKAFMNPADEHQMAETITINGQNREILFGDVMMRSGPGGAPDLAEVSKGIRDCIVAVPLSPQTHWIKIVYGQAEGKAAIVSATLDNAEDADLTAAIGKLSWPTQDEFYMAKQFIVIK